MLRAEWNGVTRARGRNVTDRGSRCEQATSGWVRKRTCTVQGISLASLNIHLGRVGGLETALRALQQGNAEKGFLQETNQAQVTHTPEMAQDTTSGQRRHRVGIWEELRWSGGMQRGDRLRVWPVLDSMW